MAIAGAKGLLIVLVLATIIILVCVYLNCCQQLTNVHSLKMVTKKTIQLQTESDVYPPKDAGVSSCEVPVGGYKAWNDGVVTSLRPVLHRNCSKLLEGDSKEAERIKNESKKWSNALSDEAFLKRASSCSWLKEELTNHLYNSQLERQFPLAYAFIVHNSPQQVFRLLKVLYRPQNTYCFHYDTKSTKQFKSLFDTMAKCFNNVIVASKIENVKWGQHTFLDAQVNCLYDLAKHRKPQPETVQWKYVINLCGKELPLTTGNEIVSRLMQLNGSSSIAPAPNTNKQRLKGKKVPFNLPTFKNSAYNALSFAFVDYLLNNKTAQTVLEFFRGVSMPEEHFYSTLYKQPGIPGGFNPNIPQKNYFRVERAVWCFKKECPSLCQGKWVHCVCIVGAGDLPNMLDYQKKAGYLFHNKYFMEMDHTVMDCVEEMLVARNKQEFANECKSNRVNHDRVTTVAHNSKIYPYHHT